MNQHTASIFSKTAIALACASLYTMPVAYADETHSIERIIVQGDLSGLSVDEVAHSATVIGAEAIAQRQASHIADVLATAANVSLTSGASRAKFIQIRGIGERSQFSEPVNPSVGIILDGWDVSGLGSLGVLVDTAQVEVLRGPQATAFGTSGLAGVINIVTNPATDTPSGELSVALGQDDLLEVKSAYSQALSDDVNVRVALSHVQNNGFVKNTYLGRDDTNGINESAGRIKVDWALSEASALALQVLKVDINNGYDAFSLDNDNVTLSDQPGKDHTNASGVALNYTRNMDWGQVSVHGGFVDASSIYAYDEDWTHPGFHPWEYASVDRYDRDRETTTFEIKAQSTRLSDTADAGAMQWVAGVFYKDTEEGLERIYTYADPNFTSYYAPTQVSVFGQVDTVLAHNVSLEAGLRMEQAKIDYADNNGFVQSNDETLVGGKLALRYTLPTSTVYASIARGYKMGGFNPDQRVADAQRIFTAEYNWNYEVGVKSRFEQGHVRLAAFYMDRKNTQISDFSTFVNDANVTEFLDVIDNADNGTNRGLELETLWTPNSAVTIGANVGYLDATFSGYTKTDGSVVAEQTAAQAPKLSYHVFGDIQLDENWGVNIQVDGRSKHRFSDGHDVQNPAYALVSATLRYTVGDVELQAFVSNLLDKAYYVRGFGGFSNDPRDYYETPEPYYQWGEGRRFGVNARYRF